MALTLSPTVRVIAVVGGLVATGLAAFVFLISRSGTPTSTPSSTRSVAKAKPNTRVTSKPSATRPASRPRVRPRSGFPARVDRALRSRRVVVVAVYLPGATVDAEVRQEARAAAIASRAGFVPISALAAQPIAQLVAKTGVLPEPAVVIVKRPGTVVTTFSVTDRETIAQAVVEAR